ncbi:hypothetical protein QBZ16_003203 [Prototheca wickerhamii]|uniref:Uncharacterized protein n=1 Tax=Prototheca wickerhamii TaxID=3111 RepID=A0AAD9MLL9_PROWI|nr:hypothetical protein QBZ16_003203 [Prototheca wickerhamii]
MAPNQADEADFLDLLIASERIDEWLETIRTSKSVTPHLLDVLKEMQEALTHGEAYIEEAREAGSAQVLTLMLKRLDPEAQDSEVTDQVARILAILSGPAACGGGPRQLVLASPAAGALSLAVYEGSLTDGVGARLWAAAHILCKALAQRPGAVRGRRVLELGAGCGACGLAAARLGAERVALTDYLDAVLDCTGASVALTLGGAAETAQGARPAPVWDADGVAVRRLNWLDDLGQEAEEGEKSNHTGASSASASSKTPSRPPAHLDDGTPYDVILGADILYEAWMAEAVAAVIARRLAPGGLALVSCAVREAAIFDTFERELAQRGLEARRQAAEPDPLFVGVAGPERNYEGGFRITAIQRASAPCTFFSVCDDLACE